MDSLKKILAVGSTVAMAVLGMVPVASATHSPGTNVVDSTGTVWNITTNNTRRGYSSAGSFTSYGFNTWGSIVPADAGDLALPQDSAGLIPPQDGTIFCATATKGTDVAGTCYLITGGQKAGFTSQANFEGLGYSFANAVYGDSSFMSSTANINSATQAHLAGTLINKLGTVYLVGSNGLLGIPDTNTFYSWGYSFKNVVPANAADNALTVTGVMAMRNPSLDQFNPTALAPTCTSNCGTPVVNGNVSASLASDNPAAGTLVANSNGTSPGQTQADLANFMFSGTGTVTQVVVNRIGVSADNSISNVYLYQGNNRVTSAGSFSNGMVTFSNSNGLFTVNGSAEISVRVDVAAGATAGQTVGAQLASFTVANGSPMSASISGNLFQIAAVSNLATAALSGTSTPSSGITSSGASQPTATGTINAGTQNAILWQASVNIGQRTVLLKHVAFTQIGSIQSSAITNYQLVVDGSASPVAATVTSAGGQTQVVFDMPSSPVSLNTGSHTIALQGNIVGGTSFTFEYSIQTAADISLFDTNYMVNVPLTYSNGGTIFQVVPGLTTINSGTVSVQSDPNFTATQFVANSSGVILGEWDMTAYGENVNVNQLQVSLKYTSSAMANGLDGFNNLTLLVNGGSVGSSQSALATTGSSTCGTSANETCTFTFGTTNLFTINAGQTVTVEVKGDSVINASDITAVQASLITPSNSLQGQTSFALSGTGQSYSATALTTGASTGTLSKNAGYSNQTVSPVTTQEIGSYVVAAGSVDGIRLNQVTVGLNGSFGSTSITNGLTGLYVAVTYPNGSATTSPVNPQSNNTFTLNNVTIPANQSAMVNVFANIGNVTGYASTTLYATAQGLTSNQSLSTTGFTSATAVTGQNITVGAGVLNYINLNSANSPASTYVASLSANQPVATYNFYATSTAGITISELGFTTGNANGAITAVTVGGVTQQFQTASSVLISGLNIPVPFGSAGLPVQVTATFNKTGSNGITGGDQAVTLTLAHVKYLAGGNTTSYSTTAWNTIKGTSDATTTVGTLGINAPAVELTGAYPALSVAATTNSGLSMGTEVHLIDTTVSAIPASPAGTVQVNQVDFVVSASNINTATLANPRLAAGSTTIAGSSCTSGTALTGSAATTSLASAITVVCTLPAGYNITAPNNQTFSLYATVNGSPVSGSTYSVAAQLSPAANFLWTDVTGDGTQFSTANTTYLANYPSSAWSTHN